MEESTHEINPRKIIFYSSLMLFFIFFVFLFYISEIVRRVSVLEKKIGLDVSPAVKALEESKKLEEQILALRTQYEKIIESDSVHTAEISLIKLRLSNLINIQEVQDVTTLSYDSSNYSIIHTHFGSFAIFLTESKQARNGVELTFGLFNPTLYVFADAKLTVTANEQSEFVIQTVHPKLNYITVLLSPIQPNEVSLLKLNLELNSIK